MRRTAVRLLDILISVRRPRRLPDRLFHVGTWQLGKKISTFPASRMNVHVLVTWVELTSLSQTTRTFHKHEKTPLPERRSGSLNGFRPPKVPQEGICDRSPFFLPYSRAYRLTFGLTPSGELIFKSERVPKTQASSMTSSPSSPFRSRTSRFRTPGTR